MKILGIDPGSRILGYGVIEKQPSGREIHIAHGVVRVPPGELSDKLLCIGQDLQSLIETYKPHVLAIESVFLGKNPHSAFVLGHVRGVCMLKAAEAGLSVREYAARTIKKVITGSGKAEKDQVRLLVHHSLGVTSQASLDATDALAIALTHGRSDQGAGDMLAKLLEVEVNG